ncbi:MAG: NADP-dependent oxidoreductase, partial [Acetobacteraceae bacterium]|nr:NADP-dependent oxidoreductase [Acetobacteraceae bacterium]
AYAEFAVAEAGMIARKPERLSHEEAASVQVVAVTAWQMLFEHAQVGASQRVLVHGAAGNVGAYAVQLARWAGADVTATASPEQAESVRALGAREVIDGRRAEAFAGLERHFNVVIDTVGGSMLTQCFDLLGAGSIVVSSVSLPDQAMAKRHGVRAEYLIVAVTTARLDRLTELLEAGTLKTRLGEVLPLSAARAAHEMLAGTREHGPGKIVLIPGR